MTPSPPPPSSVLLVIPCYKESERLPLFLRDLLEKFLDSDQVDILAVDDGSGTEEQALTEQRLERVLEDFPAMRCRFRYQKNLINHGKGAAIYSGWNQAEHHQFLMFADADGATPAHEIARLISTALTLNDPQTALFGSRVKMLGRVVERLWKRHLMGRMYATLVSELFDLPVYDSQCGCKLVPRKAYHQVQAKLTLEGFAFDMDLLLALRHEGFKVVEFPVDWREVPGGKVRLFRDSLRMVRDVLALKKRWS